MFSSQVHVQSDPIKMDTKGAIESQCPYSQAVDIKQVELKKMWGLSFHMDNKQTVHNNEVSVLSACP